jgi:uncharacterized damage-inducible protein DinB
VSDQKPPRMARDERMTLSALLRYQRESFVRKVTDLDDDAARRALVGSGTTLLWLTKHLSRAEVIWVLRRFSGADVEIPDDTVHPEDTVTSAVEAYRATWTRVDDVVHGASLEDVCRGIGGEPAINLRWVLMHLLEETARHAGHADILRELIDGATGR